LIGGAVAGAVVLGAYAVKRIVKHHKHSKHGHRGIDGNDLTTDDVVVEEEYEEVMVDPNSPEAAFQQTPTQESPQQSYYPPQQQYYAPQQPAYQSYDPNYQYPPQQQQQYYAPQQTAYQSYPQQPVNSHIPQHAQTYPQHPVNNHILQHAQSYPQQQPVNNHIPQTYPQLSINNPVSSLQPPGYSSPQYNYTGYNNTPQNGFGLSPPVNGQQNVPSPGGYPQQNSYAAHYDWNRFAQ